MAKIINLGTSPVNEGEALAIRHLELHLPNNYWLYPNIEIPQPGGSPLELDAVVIAPHAVYAIEVKDWHGTVIGDDNTWLLGRSERPNPVRSIRYKAKVIKGRIQTQGIIYKDIWVEGIVVIVDNRTVLNLKGDCNERTFYLHKVVDFIQNPKLLKSPQPIVVNALLPALEAVKTAVGGAGVQGRNRKTLSFNQYEVIETLDERPGLQEYLARNTLVVGANKVRLRVFESSPYLPETERKKREHQVTHEFRLLQSIGYHPNVLRANDLFPWNGDRLIEVTDWSNEGTLAALLLKEEPLTIARKLEIMQGLLHGLVAVHFKGILHRAINPYNILLGGDYVPRLMNFDRARLDNSVLNSGSYTVWQTPTESDALPYLAPELARATYKAYPSSDLYSLGIIFYELLAGTVPFDNPTDALKSIPPKVSEWLQGLPAGTDEFIEKLIQPHLEGRFESAIQALEVLEVLLRPTHPEPTPINPEDELPANTYTAPHIEYNLDQTIDGQYRVLALLGSGGSSKVYKVYNALHDTAYAMKIINADVRLERLQKEFKLLRALQHPSIARAEWAGQIYHSQYYLVTELVEGETLTAYTNGSQRMSIAEAVELIFQLLDALAYMHTPQADRPAILHRDIKPSNLIRTKTGIKVIDFNIAALSDEAGNTLAGTLGYIAPDVLEGGWDSSTDLFATGIVLYQLITQHHPYEGLEGSGLNNQPTDPCTLVADLSVPLAVFLQKSVMPKRADRFTNAAAMREALLAIPHYTQPVPLHVAQSQEVEQKLVDLLQISTEELARPNYNPFVTRLLTLYSQARRNNRGTRGLDGIAKVTYIPTLLDEKLRPDILMGKHRLIVITGNAGDGKTAFIQQIEEAVREEGATVSTFSHRNGSQFRYNGYHFVTNYDGSQDEGENVNDLVLQEFFKPFAGNLSPLEAEAVMREVRIIAINEGRLRDFFETNHSSFAWLRREILNFFDESQELATGLLVVNLNWRSVVANRSESIFSRQLKRLADDAFWYPCESCEFRERCFIKFNADTLRDPVNGTEVIERWRTLFETVHLRRRLHITMRDLRSALSYILLRDHSCSDVAESLNVDSDEDYLHKFYYNALLGEDAQEAQKVRHLDNIQELTPPNSIEVRSDRLVRLLSQIDVALVSNPQLDRELHYSGEGKRGPALFKFETRTEEDEQRLQRLENGLVFGYEVSKDSRLITSHRMYHQFLRRKAFFEQRDAANWIKMLPYEQLESFRKITQQDVQQLDYKKVLAELKAEIIGGISASEGSRNRTRGQASIWLRASQTDKPSIQSYRLFPANEFELTVRSIGKLGDYLEYLPDHLILRHKREKAELVISLDLLELLFSIGRGFRPSLNDLRGPYVNLLIFRNALSHLPFRELLLTQDDQQFYRLAADQSNVISLTKEEGR